MRPLRLLNQIIVRSPMAARTVTSTINNKEDQGDNNESTDTASSGIGLP